MMPEAFAHSVEFHRVESRRASAILVTRPKGPARPNSMNPAFVASNGSQVNGVTSRRSSQHYEQQLPLIPNDVPALPPPQITLPEVWQAPKTTEEAAAALAALAEREESLRLYQHEEKRRTQEGEKITAAVDSNLHPRAAVTEQRPRTAEGQQRPLTADSNRPTTSGTVESDMIPTTAHSPEQAAIDVVLSPAPGAIKAVQVGKPTLTSSNDLQVTAVTREGSVHSSASKENKPPPSPALGEVPKAEQRKAEKERLERDRIEKEKMAARKAEQEKVLTEVTANVRNTSRPTSAVSNKRKSTASINRKSTNTINLIMADVPLTPLMPSLPSSPFPTVSPHSPGSKKQDAAFDEKAFLAKMRAPINEDAAKEADRRSRSMSTTSQLNHRISHHSIKGRKTPSSSRPGSAHGHVHAGGEGQLGRKSEESKRGKELRMRNNAVKQAGSAHLNATVKPLAGEGKKKNASATKLPDLPVERSPSRTERAPSRATERAPSRATERAPSRATERTPSRATGRKTPTSSTTQTPSILKKTTKSPANSRPPSRSATLAGGSRSRANSTATAGAGGSAIAGIKSQPLPQTEFPVKASTSVKKQKSVPALSSKESVQALMSAYRFPEIAHDEPALSASPFVGLGLQHSNSSSNNFSRPGSSAGKGPGAKSLTGNLAGTIASTMPAPPDPVYRSRSRMNRHGSGDSTRAAPAKSLHSVRSFTNDGSSERPGHSKRVSVDQTGNMTDASLKLLAKMEEELARRGGAESVAGGRDNASIRAPSRGPSRLGRSESRMTVEKGGPAGATVEERDSWEKEDAASVGKKKNRGCMGCLGR